ncbi:MAG: two-partner secretion domain-containing protein, partial [Leptospirales bacterium]
MKRTRTLRTFSLSRKIVALVLSGLIPITTLPGAALALPHGGVVSKGAATLGYATGRLAIRQSTNSATFDWGSYNVKAGQSVVYSVPGSKSVSLNYIGGSTPSSIDGSVTSNGILEFMNPNGLIFGSGSVVSAAGVMAFGSATPWGKPTGAVTNAGTLTATNNGTVALVGTSVSNSGTITAPGGEVILAAGESVTPLATTGVSSVSVVTTGGGTVDDSGIVSAETLNGKTGAILLQSGMGSGTTTLEATAVLDASAPNGGNGGSITVNGYKVVLDETAPLNVSAPYGTTGTITIDPNYTDITTPSALEAVDSSQVLTGCVSLGANITLGGFSWNPLGTSSSAAFTGTFNGNGYTVSGYTITANSNGTGFIGYLGSGGIVKNLGVSGTVNGGSYSYVGGVVGDNFGTVEYSYNTGTVSGTVGSDVGGVVGGNSNTGTVEYSYNTGTVSGTVGSDVGGVV